MTISLTQCFEEIPERVIIIPFNEIEAKLAELRELQKELNGIDVNILKIQAQIDELIIKINDKADSIANSIPPTIVPLTYTVGIISSASVGSQIGISDATVSLDLRGTRTTLTTDSNGQVVFTDLRAGVVLVYVSVAGYTDVSFVANLLVTDGTPGEEYDVVSTIALYPTTSANGAVTLDGTIYNDTDRTNDWLSTDPLYETVNYVTGSTFGDVQPYRPAPLLNLVDGVDIGTTQDILDARIQSWNTVNQAVNLFAFIQPDTLEFSYIPIDIPGNILLAIYEEMFVSTVSDASNGTFQLVIPVGVNGNNYRIHAEEFIGNENYIRSENLDTGTGNTTQTPRIRSVIYTAMYFKIGTGPTIFLPGTSGGTDFDQLKVNNFSGSTLDFTGANSSLKSEIYFGAKTLNE